MRSLGGSSILMTCARKHGTRSGKLIGRPRADIPVKNLINAYQETNSVRKAARIVGVNPGLAWFRLKEAGVLESSYNKQSGLS